MAKGTASASFTKIKSESSSSPYRTPRSVSRVNYDDDADEMDLGEDAPPSLGGSSEAGYDSDFDHDRDGEEEMEDSFQDDVDETDVDPNAEIPEFAIGKRMAFGKSTTGRIADGVIGLLGSKKYNPKMPVVDLSDADLLIVHLKTRGYSDAQISEIFEGDEDLPNLAAKQIPTRFMRSLQAQQEELDYKLDHDLIEWSQEDDANLIKAQTEVDEEIEQQIERLKDRRFKMISDQMRRENPESKYSTRACKERFAALADGTAPIPWEAAGEEGEARQAARIERIKRLEIEEAERERIEAEQAARLKEYQHAREAQRRLQQDEADAKRLQKLRKEQQNALNWVAEKNAAVFAEKRRIATRLHGTKQAAERAIGHDGDGDPRNQLTTKQLRDLCTQKSLSNEGNKIELLARLRTIDERQTVAQLRRMCRDLGRQTSGIKEHLLFRIAEQDTRQFISEENVSSFLLGFNSYKIEEEDDEDDDVFIDDKGAKIHRGKSCALAPITFD